MVSVRYFYNLYIQLNVRLVLESLLGGFKRFGREGKLGLKVFFRKKYIDDTKRMENIF